MRNFKIKYMVTAAILSALAFVFTAYLHIPVYNGYVHIGDGIIYLAACLLPTPYGVFTGAVSALLADTLTGYAIYAPASVLIKSLTVLFFSSKGDKLLTKTNTLALVWSLLLCVGGYFIYEAFVFGVAAAAAGVYGNIAQSVCSAILFAACGAALDRTGLSRNLTDRGKKDK